HRAGVNGLAIQENGAGAARSAVANFLRPGYIKAIAQRIEQGDTGFNFERAGLAIDLKGEGELAGTQVAGLVLGCLGAGFDGRERPRGRGADADTFEKPAPGNPGASGRISARRHVAFRLSTRRRVATVQLTTQHRRARLQTEVRAKVKPGRSRSASELSQAF